MTNNTIAHERRRAAESLRAAELCWQAGLYADAVSRAYYSAFHTATALIGMRGLIAKSKRGLRTLVKREFIDSGLLEQQLDPEIEHLHDLRIVADYRSRIQISEPEAVGACHTAARFLDAAGPLLDEAAEAAAPGG